MPEPSLRTRFLHPASGALILGLDWLLFSGSALTLGLSTPMLALIGFALGGVGTGLIQGRYGRDKNTTSVVKGFLGGLAVGIPLPIAGTALGGGILTLSGLDRLRKSDNAESQQLSEEDPK
jgi:4-amino-4-deoxy-L-arabinose transferase-like glycosyltransferase